MAEWTPAWEPNYFVALYAVALAACPVCGGMLQGDMTHYFPPVAATGETGETGDKDA